MKYLSYIDNQHPETIIKMQYDWPLDIKLLAAINFVIQNWSWQEALCIVIDAINWTLHHESIMNTFNSRCTIKDDDIHNILNKKVVTVSDLFS